MILVDLSRTAFVVAGVTRQDAVRGLQSIPGAKLDAAKGVWRVPIVCAAYLAAYANDHGAQLTEPAQHAIRSLHTERAPTVPIPDLDAPLANGRRLYAHQKTAVEFLIRRGRAILADDMGLGKSLSALMAASAYRIPVHVLCPASLRDNWAREAAMIGMNVHTHSWAKVPPRIEGRFVLIADECFPAGTMVRTDAGLIPIDRIVDDQMHVRIASIASDGTVTYRPIVRYIRKTTPSTLYRITHEYGSLVCTGNHPIYTAECGYIRTTTAAARARHEDLHLSVLRGDVRDADGRARAVLLKDMLEPTAGADAGISGPMSTRTGAGVRDDESAGADQAPGRSRTHAQKQPDAHAGSHGEDAAIHDGQAVQMQGRERAPYATAKGDFGPFEFAYGSGHPDEARAASVLQDPPGLQGGPFAPRIEDGDRDRWEVASASRESHQGSEEDRRPCRSRILGIEVLERGSGRIPRDSGRTDHTVYNLEVEHTHSYFADGVLVGNCHYAQSGTKSQRGKSFLALAEQAEALFLLSGTPMKNGRPANLFPLLRAVGSPLAKDKGWFERRYCDAKPTRWSTWDATGACRLPELAERARPVMLRRMKTECLDLPEKVRVMREASRTAEASRLYTERLHELLSRKDGDTDALAMFTYRRMASSAAKVASACEVIDEILEQGGSIVVFAEFLQTVHALHARYADTCAMLTGATAQDERQGLVDRLQRGEARVFVTTFGAGGVGITLTRAQTVLLVDRPWTPGDCYQAEDRIHRIGQTGSSVLSIWLQWDDTDKAVDALLEAKTERIEVVMNGRRVEVEAGISMQKFAEMTTRK